MVDNTFRYIDNIAINSSLDENSILKSLTLDDVEQFLRTLGVNEIEKHEDFLIRPTICHNPIDEATSMKLYYYNKTKTFHCYTECSENFNIIELYKRYMAINFQEIQYIEAFSYIKQFLSFKTDILPYEGAENPYKIDEYSGIKIITLPPINENVMDCFIPFPHPLWVQEGITKEVHQQFDIRFCYGQNKIIIPHRDINGHLVGIRSRAIEKEDIEKGKYRPVQIGGKLYNHQLGFNLYGIWEHKEAIKKFKRVIIYEGEKSVLKDSVFYKEYSTAVATCGSQLNKFQINLLIQELGVNEIILAYDKEYDNCYSEEGKKYRKNLIDKCKKYHGLATFYYLFDEDNFLDKKDAPCDKGQEILERLFERRIKIK